jgi:hypothetical protein
MFTNQGFTWYQVTEYGTAAPVPDSPEVSARVNASPAGWYGTIEGAILHGGVIATAYKRKTEQTYDAAHWLRTGELLPAGEVTITTITAEREG